MLRDLADLGVANDCVRVGFPYVAISQVDVHGVEYVRATVQRLPGQGCPAALAMTHGALIDVLLNAARQAGVCVRTGVYCERVESIGDGVLADFGQAGRDNYDLVVAADGAASPIRRTFFASDWAPVATGQIALQVPLRRPPALDGPVVVGMSSCRAIAIPVSNERASLVLVYSPAQQQAEQGGADARFIRDRLKACAGLIAGMRDQLTGDEAVVLRPVRAGVFPEPWYRGRVLLVGEAAHVVPPQLGQAAAQCVADATVLGALLREAGSVEALLQAFMRRRYERCRMVHDASLQVVRWEIQPDSAADIHAVMGRQALVLAEPP